MSHRSPPALPAVLVLALALTATVGCRDKVQERLSNTVSEQASSVAIGDQNIDVVCKSGDKLTVPTAELKLNKIGMVKKPDLALVAQKIANQCQAITEKKAREKDELEMFLQLGKSLGVDVSKMASVPERRTACCAKLIEKLPRKEPERTDQGIRNVNAYGCPPPPPPPELPWKDWELDKEKGKPFSLKHAGDDNTRIVFKCEGKEASSYVSLGKVVKKGTKEANVLLDDDKKGEGWKILLSTDGKSFFFKDAKAAARGLSGKKTATMQVPPAKGKKPLTVTFDLDGFDAGWKEAPRACR